VYREGDEVEGGVQPTHSRRRKSPPGPAWSNVRQCGGHEAAAEEHAAAARTAVKRETCVGMAVMAAEAKKK
jgi:hypothetical protein